MTLKERLPVLIGLVAIAIVFQSLNANFLSARNLTNLGLQIAAMSLVACGLVFVLLLGEIDLSAGAVSGLGAAVMGVVGVRFGLPGPLCALAALLTGAAIGLFQGVWITRFTVPSFVVTLAGLLAWQGAQLGVLGDTGSLNLNDGFIVGLCATFLPPLAGGALLVAAITGVALTSVLSRRWVSAGRLGLLGISGGLPLAIFSADRGVPLAVVLVVGVVALMDAVVRRTRFGRHVLAVGGNAEAARRAGISVERVRIAVFALGSMLAAAGGVLAASRLLAVNQSSGGGDLLLNAIASAVIGGTSLFGGRGSVWSALIGALAIGGISNGMDLLGWASPVKYGVTGAVLLLAVTVDALARSRSAAR
ncbi:MAG: sugar ABC transporter permease [Archangiaceae bacterium]|nr:sugar ABC transporter permease [Archangiaceae bacterium]